MNRMDVVIAVVVRDGKVLVCQRRDDDTFGGYWEFPGGKQEPGETAEDCLSRELQEELAIGIRPLELLTPVEHDYPTARIRLVPYLCTLTAGEPQPLACQRAVWVEPRALCDLKFPPANDGLIEEIIRRLEAPPPQRPPTNSPDDPA